MNVKLVTQWNRREYYNVFKKGFAKWKNRDVPYWFNPVNDSLEHHQVTKRVS